MTSGQSSKRLLDQTTLDHWLSVNAIFGAIIVFGLLAMALIGSAGSGAIQRAGSTVEVSSIAIHGTSQASP